MFRLILRNMATKRPSSIAKRDTAFIETVLEYHRDHGRHHLPWRRTTNPYRILVSEVMLQQTQVDRVIPKYKAFLKQFPNPKQLATASLAEVLTAWQGLGYNRRAKLLKQCAEVITSEHHGRWPKTYDELLVLPGVGPYTAAAVLAFAYNQAVPLIETNVRTVYLHHWFPNDTDVTDAEILALLTKHLPYTGEARTWYAALMDYGSHLKKTRGNPNSRAKNYSRQSTFKGSDRQVRGAIIRALAEHPATAKRLEQTLSHLKDIQLYAQLDRLLDEGMIQKTKQTYHLPN
jgi:A/G-specific adenine glycosylase